MPTATATDHDTGAGAGTPDHPLLATMTRYADGTPVTFVPVGHLVTDQMRCPFDDLDVVRSHTLDTIGLVENWAGWVIRIGRSADGAVLDSRNGSRWGVLAVAITDPHGHTENLIRFARPGHLHQKVTDLMREDTLIHPGLFARFPALSDPDYQAATIRWWAKAIKAHAWMRTLVHPRHTDLPKWKTGMLLHWLDWDSADDAAAWFSTFGMGRHDTCIRYQQAGWDLRRSAPWVHADIEYPVAQVLADHGWDTTHGTLIRHAILAPQTYDYPSWEHLGAVADWVDLGLDPTLTVLAALGGLSVDEAATVTSADRDGLVGLALLRADDLVSGPLATLLT